MQVQSGNRAWVSQAFSKSNQTIHYGGEVAPSQWMQDFNNSFGKLACYGIGGMLLATAAAPALLNEFIPAMQSASPFIQQSLFTNGNMYQFSAANAGVDVANQFTVRAINNMLDEFDIADVLIAGTGLTPITGAFAQSSIDLMPFVKQGEAIKVDINLASFTAGITAAGAKTGLTLVARALYGKAVPMLENTYHYIADLKGKVLETILTDEQTKRNK